MTLIIFECCSTFRKHNKNWFNLLAIEKGLPIACLASKVCIKITFPLNSDDFNIQGKLKTVLVLIGSLNKARMP